MVSSTRPILYHSILLCLFSCPLMWLSSLLFFLVSGCYECNRMLKYNKKQMTFIFNVYLLIYIVFLYRILCYNGSLVTWTVTSLTTAKFKPLMFSVSGFALPYDSNVFILMILYDFCLLPAQFCYVIIYIRKVENCVQIADRCAPWKISIGAQNLVL
jgi:hypothetical protein